MIQSVKNWRTSKSKVFGRSRQLTVRARGRLDAQRSCARAGRHLHRTACPGTARQGRCGAVQVWSQ